MNALAIALAMLSMLALTLGALVGVNVLGLGLGFVTSTSFPTMGPGLKVLNVILEIAWIGLAVAIACRFGRRRRLRVRMIPICAGLALFGVTDFLEGDGWWEPTWNLVLKGVAFLLLAMGALWSSRD